MRDFDTLEYHPQIEKLVNILCTKTQNRNPEFFRVILNYYLAKATASMRVKIADKTRGEIPVNLYAINLAASGHGKGYSSSIIEETLLHHFKDNFFNDVYPILSEDNLRKIAIKRAIIQNEDEEEMLDKVTKEFRESGKFFFSFDSATSPAIKQMRHKLLMANIGSVNLEIDEIGSNLLGNVEALSTFLELFDIGKVKNKLTKDTKDNSKGEEIEGRTPTNLLMFGTPARLFDGGKTEEEFYNLLETGYARRSLFGFSKQAKKTFTTPEELYDKLTDPDANKYLKDFAEYLGTLANILNHNKTITVPKKVSILVIKYRMYCEKLAEEFGEHQELARAELSHRYFKALKLAGVYAFINGDDEITEDTYYHAICMTENSGKAFNKILSRDRTYVKLAKYLGSVGHEVTHVELTEDLPFFRGSASNKHDLIQLATAWGYKNHILIKKTVTNGIEFLHGESLKKTDLDHLLLSFSSHISDGYQNVQAPWDKLYKLTQQPGKNWINHHSNTGHRSEKNICPGFDMVVLDIDGGTPIKEVMLLMREYKFMIYTTKRHTTKDHRFRVILPLNYNLKLDEEEYSLFMKNLYEWLPMTVDTQTCQRSRKWLSHKGQYHYNKGEKLLDARLFIPKTAKDDERRQFIDEHQSLTNIERWFVANSGSGNRNNQLIRYAFMLKDLNYSFEKIREKILSMNSKLPNKLTKKEIENTILASIARKTAKAA